MVRVRHWWPLAGMVAVVSVSGCIEDRAEDIERPQASKEVVSDAQLDAFMDAGAEVFGGMAPPGIGGTYYFGDRVVDYTTSEKWPQFDFWCHEEVTFTEGDSENVYLESADSPNCDISAEGTANYISGDGDCFTLYRTYDFAFEGCEGDSVAILSACLDSDGNMEEPISGTLITSSEGCGTMVNEGRIKADGELAITRQASGVAQRME